MGDEQGGHRILHRLVVDAEHEGAEHGPQLGLLGVEQLAGRRLVGRLGRDADLDALDEAQQTERAERIGLLVDDHRFVAGEDRQELARHQLPPIDLAVVERRRRRRRIRDVDPFDAVEFDDLAAGDPARLLLARHILGEFRVDDLVTDRADQTRRRPPRLGDERGTFGEVGLPGVALGHLPTTRPEEGPDRLDHLLVPPKRHVHHLGDRLACDVVLGRPEAAAHDDGVAASQRRAQGEHDALPVVADLGLEVRVDADHRQVLTDPRRVRVDDLAEEQLGADGDDFTPHGAGASRR